MTRIAPVKTVRGRQIRDRRRLPPNRLYNQRDVRKAFEAIPLAGKDAKFTGTVQDSGSVSTHLQGLAAHGGIRAVVETGGSMSARKVARARKGLTMAKKKAPRRTATRSASRDLSAGVIVILSGGAFDLMNPPEVRDRMDEYIVDVNADPYVQANTGGNGLTFKLLRNQQLPHLHQTKWRQVCAALNLLAATPLILVGHSNGGAAAVDLARCLKSQGKTVDLLFTADSVLTLDDIGDVNKIPSNVKLNFNSYVIPTPAWLLAPFPIGTRNRRQADDSLDGILNIGLTYNLPGALAHRNAFYEIAGGDKTSSGVLKLPNLLLDVTLAELRGETNFDIIQNAETPLQQLATKSRVVIELETTTFKKTLRP